MTCSEFKKVITYLRNHPVLDAAFAEQVLIAALGRVSRHVEAHRAPVFAWLKIGIEKRLRFGSKSIIARQ
jgi:hypothetical protein